MCNDIFAYSNDEKNVASKIYATVFVWQHFSTQPMAFIASLTFLLQKYGDLDVCFYSEYPRNLQVRSRFKI